MPGARQLALSVLDQSPVPAGSTPAEALRATLELAELADDLGYRRYWLAEHHAMRGLAGSAPEITIGHVAARTSRIRVGSGGIMLPHYSPLKVAEVFRTLEALHPGRIDLGVGRAPGSDPLTATALSPRKARFSIDGFPEQVRELLSWLQDEGDRAARVRATPEGTGSPELWLLGSSGEGARIAAEAGLPHCFAHFISPYGGPEATAAYHAAFRPSPLLATPRAIAAVGVVCAETDEEAERLAASVALWRLRLVRGDPGPIPTVEEALARDYTPMERAALAEQAERLVVGSPERVRARLLALADAYATDELVIVTITHDPRARQRSYELLAEAFALSRNPPTGGEPPEHGDAAAAPAALPR